ncbi:Aste57867_13133 [Aphanomyces stellatus]|uniref:Aste57867_13133 protein n=1 Tax=Aphanomyces stellatus TaxID=120398 RepID=A0A485KZ09_9STRA|nr:hypothetical protein As57867_013084 [Aphanomyces stellatus]VFT89975.1 Aste57867_13133 [Aphanomyces stellatus]
MTPSPARIAALLCLGAVAAAGHRMELHRLEGQSNMKRDLHTNTRLRRLTDGSFEAVPLHLGMGTHYTWVYAGTPPQRASVIVDTGSHLMAFPCNGCDKCGTHTDAPFDATKSSTLKYPSCSNPLPFSCHSCTQNDQCAISQSYTEGSSWEAVVVEDTVWLGDDAAHPDRHFNESYGTRYMFGCQKHETGACFSLGYLLTHAINAGLFISQVANGIMGMSNTDSNLVRKLFVEHKVDTSAFSLCFAPQGGTMALGTLSTTHHQGEIQYAAITSQQSGWYGITVTELRFGDQKLQVDLTAMNSKRHVIVDSGTTDSYLPREYADTWNAVFSKVTGRKYQTDTDQCDGFSDAEIAAMPPFEMHMQGAIPGQQVVLSIPASQLFAPNGNGKRCGSMYMTEQAGGVIGANFMMNHEFVFDPDNMRVGFSPANCDYRGLDAEMTPHTTIPTSSIAVTAIATTAAASATTPPSTKSISPSSIPTPLPTNITSVGDDDATPTTTIPTSILETVTTAPLDKGLFNDTTDASARVGDKGPTQENVRGEFSFMGILVFVCLGLVVGLSAYHIWYKKRNSARTVTKTQMQWVKVSTVQPDDDNDAAERAPLGEEPLSIHAGDEEDDDDDEFFDSEGYVMSPRSIRRCREAFGDVDAQA